MCRFLGLFLARKQQISNLLVVALVSYDVVLLLHCLRLTFARCAFCFSTPQLVSEAYADWFWRRAQDRENQRLDQHVDPTWYFRYMEDRETHRGDPSWIFQVCARGSHFRFGK